MRHTCDIRHIACIFNAALVGSTTAIAALPATSLRRHYTKGAAMLRLLKMEGLKLLRSR